MAAKSLGRQLLKKVLFPILNERIFRFAQCLAKAWDIRTGSWSEPELDLIPFAVREGDTVLDIGANYGLYSYYLSRAVGPSGHVYAFEPVPFTNATFRLISKILDFRNVELIPKGCGDRAGRVAFTLPIQASGAISAGLAHIAKRDNERPGKDKHFKYDTTREIWCEVVVLDKFLPQLSNLSFIKSDIEGADLLALRGAEKIIEQHHPTVLCEINPWFLEGFGLRLQEFLEFFFSKGYSMYSYEVIDGHKLLKAIMTENIEDILEDNYLFVHPHRADRFAPLAGKSY